MARTALTVPSAYNPDGVKANYDANIAASNDNFEELYGVETQTITTTPVNITMPIVVLAYATGGAKVVKLPAVANTTLRRINVTKTVGVTSTATISPQTGEYLDGVQNGTLAMTDLGLSVTFQVIDGKWVSDWVGKSAAAPDGQNMAFKPGGTDKSFVFQTDVANGSKIKIVDTTLGITDEYPSTWIQANRVELGQGSSYVGAVLSGRSDGALVLTSGNDKCHLAADTGENVVLEVDAGQNVQLVTGTYTATLTADSSSRLVSTSGFAGSGAGLTDVPDSALSANVPLLDAANAFTNTNTVTVPTGTALAGTGTISATLLGDLSANTGTNTAWADGDNTKLWWAQKFTAGATTTAAAVSLKLAKGSATAPTLASSTITAYLFSDNAGAVNALLTGGTGTSIRFDALTSTTPAEFYFGGMSASLTQGTAYWIVVKASAFETSAGSIVHDSKSATAGTYGTYNTGTSTWDYTAELAAWCKVHSAGGVGLSGTSTINNGVVGTSTTGYGGSFTSTQSRGLYATGYDYGAYATASSAVGIGLYADSPSYYAVWATGVSGIYANGTTGFGVRALATSGLSIFATQSGASGTNPVTTLTRTSASNGTGPILLLNNAGSAVSGNLITAQTGGVDKFSVGVEGNIITAGTIAATGGVTANTFPLIQWRGSSASDPTENLAEGQMYWNTSGSLKIYTGSAWVIVGVGP